jgi:hypothetical protein
VLFSAFKAFRCFVLKQTVSAGPYSPEFLADLERTMSIARLSRYVRATGGDQAKALKLYEDNMALSEALFGFLHGLEVTVRNSLHYEMSTALRGVDWLRDGLPLPWPIAPRLSFTGPMNDMVAEARRAAGIGAPIGKVIAELPFGFWPNLISKQFHALWSARLHKAFPHAHVPRRAVHWRLEVIRRLRNRIAHHEPILTSGNEVYTGYAAQPTITLPQLLQCVEWVSPPTAQWMTVCTRYSQATGILTICHGSGVVL